MCKWFERWPCQSSVKRDWTFFSPPLIVVVRRLFSAVCVLFIAKWSRPTARYMCLAYLTATPFRFWFLFYFLNPPQFSIFLFVLHLLFNRGKYVANMCVFFLNRLGFICFAPTSCLRAASSVKFFPPFFFESMMMTTWRWFDFRRATATRRQRVVWLYLLAGWRLCCRPTDFTCLLKLL